MAKFRACGIGAFAGEWVTLMAGIDVQSAEFQDQLLDLFAAESMLERSELSMDTELDNLSIESADIVMILMAIEEKYGVYISVDDDFSEAKTLKDLVGMISNKVEEAQTEKLDS